MEGIYQQHFITSNFVRLRMIFRFCFPLFIGLRMYPIACWLLSYNVDHMELVEAAIKFSGIICFSIVLSHSWSDSAKGRIGLVFLWIMRVGWLSAVLGQARGHSYSQARTSFVWMVCISGLMMPNILEYFGYAITVSYIRPLLLFWTTSSSPASEIELVEQIVYQHSLVLALGFCITWTFHSDFRRDWLRSPSDCTKHASIRTNPTKGRNVRADKRHWDMLDDLYFSDADRLELSAEVTQVF